MSTYITKKCNHPDCNNQMQVKPHILNRGEGKFCSVACKGKSEVKYTPEVVEKILELWGKKKPVEIAVILGITPSAFRKRVCMMREEGYDLPRKRKKGGISNEERLKRRRDTDKRKTPEWKAVAQATRPEKVKVMPTPHNRVSEVRIAQDKRRATNKENWALNTIIGTREIHIAENERVGKVAVKIDAKTTYMVYPHEVERILQKHKRV